MVKNCNFTWRDIMPVCDCCRLLSHLFKDPYKYTQETNQPTLNAVFTDGRRNADHISNKTFSNLWKRINREQTKCGARECSGGWCESVSKRMNGSEGRPVGLGKGMLWRLQNTWPYFRIQHTYTPIPPLAVLYPSTCPAIVAISACAPSADAIEGVERRRTRFCKTVAAACRQDCFYSLLLMLIF